MAPSGPWDHPEPSGITVPASQPCSHPMCTFFHPGPRASSPPGETCASTDSFPRCPWSRMRPGVSPEAHPLGCGRSQRGLTREGPAVGGEAVSPGDRQPHAPRPRAQSPRAKRDGSSTPTTCGSVLPAELTETLRFHCLRCNGLIRNTDTRRLVT